jgi:hypothetical protein
MDSVAAPSSAEPATAPLLFDAALGRQWLVANVVAFPIALGIGGGVLRSLLQPAIETAPTRMDVAWIGGVSTAVAALVMGTILGVAQWLVLRRAIDAAWWLAATCLGCVLAGFLVAFTSGGASWNTRPEAGPVTPLLPTFVVVPLAVVFLSAGQWLVLRQSCAATAWWLLVNVGALAVALVFGFVVASALPFIASTDFPSAKALVIVGAAAGPVYGYGTWLFLSQLRRRAA